jgi:hypothetical protein
MARRAKRGGGDRTATAAAVNSRLEPSVSSRHVPYPNARPSPPRRDELASGGNLCDIGLVVLFLPSPFFYYSLYFSEFYS